MSELFSGVTIVVGVCSVLKEPLEQDVKRRERPFASHRLFEMSNPDYSPNRLAHFARREGGRGTRENLSGLKRWASPSCPFGQLVDGSG